MDGAKAITAERAAWFRAHWLIRSSDDLIYFVGSVATSYALLFLNQFAGVSMVVLYWIWLILFDGPHVFGTVSRTYCDTQEWTARRRLLAGSLLFFALGPAMVFLKLGKLFFAFAGIWAYYHLVKQHYGFMVLYKKKNDDLSPVDNVIDRGFLLTALTYPFLQFMFRDERARGMLPFVLPEPVVAGMQALLFWLFAAGLAVFLGRQLQKLFQGEALNLPKHLLLLAVVPMHFIVLGSDLGPRGVIPVLTIYHNIQYHRLVWFHNRNKYQNPAVNVSQYGVAALVSRRFLYYILIGILFTLAYRIPNYLLRDYEWTLGFFWGFAFVHYYLDSKIWRVRRDARLGESLRMATA